MARINHLMSVTAAFTITLSMLLSVAAPPERDGGGEPAKRDAAGAREAEPAPAPVTPTATLYPTAAAAVQALLATKPRVLAVGEYHQTTATARIPSALKRFTRDILPALRAAGATHLVVETWMTTGECGETEKQAVAEVAKTTKRPAQTESEVVTLLREAKQAGIQPGILEVACRDYQAMTTGKEVDFDRLLRLTGAQLATQLRAALARRDSGLVLSYGGALHNDLHPTAELAPYAFGPAIAAAVGGRYLELDLYVPELVEKNPTIRAQPWYQIYRRAERPGAVTLVRLGEKSFALVFPRKR
jgi:hypothetical protein